MTHAAEAVRDERGEEEPNGPDTALLSEAALAEDWDRLEEDAAWSHLQPALPSVQV